MDARIEEHLLELGGLSNLVAVRQHLNYFGSDTADLRNQFIDRLIQEKLYLEAEWWLLRDTRSSNKQQAAEAYYRLAELMRRLNRPEDAASCLRPLARDLGEQPVGGFKTAGQAIEAVAADATVRRYMAADEFWPTDVVKNESLARNLDYSGMPLEVGFGREPFAMQLALEMDLSKQEVLVRDGFGRDRFRVALYDPSKAGRSNRVVNYGSLPWARAAGHIVLIQSGTQILAVDALSSERDGKGSVLWRQDLADILAESGATQQRPPQGPNRRRPSLWMDQTGKQVGGIWPVGHELICLQRGNKLLGIDVFSGQILWTRQDIQPAEEIFGDNELLFVVPPGAGDATVLRCLDGTKVGTRRVPATDQTCGRMVLTFSTTSGKAVARVYDAWTEEEVWQRSFAVNAKFESLDSEEFAILDPQGKLVVYSLEKRRPIVDSDVEPETALADLQVFRTSDRYVVLAARQLTYRQGMPHMYPVQNVIQRNAPVVEGRVYGFDRRTGKQIWTVKDFGPTSTLVNQPAHLPLMVFAMNMNEQLPRGGQKASTSVSVLDTRNGRVFGPHKVDNGSSTIAVVAEPEAQALEIRCASGTVKLTFGSKEANERSANGDANQPEKENKSREKQESPRLSEDDPVAPKK
jgi:hypothetical protein